MKNLMDYAIGSVVFWLVGFSLMFGKDNGGLFGSISLLMSGDLFTLPANISKFTFVMAGYAAIKGFDDNGNPPDGATSVEGIVKVDDHTLQFIFKAPTALVTVENSFGRYLMTLPKHKLENIPVEELSKNEWFNHPDAVSGPYVVSEYDGNHYISYVANQNYWKGAPKINKLNIKIVEGSQLYAGLQSGEIDFVQPTMG